MRELLLNEFSLLSLPASSLVLSLRFRPLFSPVTHCLAAAADDDDDGGDDDDVLAKAGRLILHPSCKDPASDQRMKGAHPIPPSLSLSRVSALTAEQMGVAGKMERESKKST